MKKIKYVVLISNKAEKEINKMPEEQIERIRKSFDKILKDPFCGKALKGKFSGFYSLRVWPYRVIYEVKKNKLIIFILKIAHRKDAYK